MRRQGQLDLWSLLPRRRPKQPKVSPPEPKPVGTARSRLGSSGRSEGPKPGSMGAKYHAMERDLLTRYGVRVRKWRSSMSGVAWEVHYRDGTISRLIEAPKPRGPMSAAVFCHEIGHHAIGFKTYKPRCLEEYHAWEWSLRTMAQYELNVTQRVRDRMHDSLHYAVLKAARRGLKRLPSELSPYVAPRVGSPRCRLESGKPIA